MIDEQVFSRAPLRIRRGVPVFVEKDAVALQADRYERYWEVVVRQLLLHYADAFGRENGFRPAYEFVLRAATDRSPGRILEVGGGVGRLSGELALRFPRASVYLADYAYNMLRSARELWLEGKKVDLDGRHLGWPREILNGRQLSNLWLGQARGEELPFQDDSMEVVVSTFFLDRAADLERGVREQWRVLQPGGRLIAVSPLNFQQRGQWEKYGTPEKLTAIFQGFGLRLIKFEPEITCREPLDGRGNVILWRAAGWVLEKRPPYRI